MAVRFDYRNLDETSVELFWESKELFEYQLLFKTLAGEFALLYEGSGMLFQAKRLQPGTKYRFKLRYGGSFERVLDIATFAENSGEQRLRNLMGAIVTQDTFTAMDMIQHHAYKPEARDKDGLTVLMLACKYLPRHPEIIQAICLKADVNATTMAGKTALMIACRSGNASAAKVLLGCGAPIDQQDNGGSTALMWACDANQADSVELLLANGADVNKRDGTGNTALSRVCFNPGSSLQIARMLMMANANVNTKNDTGAVPLLLAQLAKNEELQVMLSDFGAKPAA